KHFNHRNPTARRDLAASIRNLRIPDEPRGARRKQAGLAGDDAELAQLRSQMRAHPCHGCHDREEHARWAERFTRLQKENDALARKAEGRTHLLSRTFDRICALLTERGYLLPADQAGPIASAASAGEPVAEAGKQRISLAGQQLSRIWSESDLLIAECLSSGCWAGLDAAELAGVCSAVVYEARRDELGAPKLPTGKIRDALAETLRLWGALSEREAEHGLPTTREPDLGFVWASYRWARGDSLEKVLNSIAADGSALPAGDFVRWMRQLLDLTEQLSRADAIDPAIRTTAGAACAALRRGVVAQHI
ncbi:MAG: RNA helicase, partial [Jatrophihabitantaceae bacterium]